MKKSFLTLFLTVVLLQMGCSSDSSSNPPATTVQGQWKLVAVDGTFAGIHETFTPGLITWTFNANNNTVTVVNNNTNPDAWDLLDTGVYNYQYINNPDSPCGEQIEIDGSIYGCYTITSESFIIDQAIADGYTITLKQ
jgi:hypothetical protein